MQIQRNQSLSQQTAQKLLSQIREGSFMPGDMLPSENELAKAYGVSRTIVREALASMKNDNILEARQGKGIFVKDPQKRQAFRFSDVFDTLTRTEMRHLYEMRAMLESEAAMLAALRFTEQDRQAIARGIDALEQAVRLREPGEEGHDAFNEAIAQASHNPVLIEFLSFIRGTLRSLAQTLRINTMVKPDRAELVLREHKAIAEAIYSRNPEEAQKTVRIHMCNAAQRAGFVICNAEPDDRA